MNRINYILFYFKNKTICIFGFLFFLFEFSSLAQEINSDLAYEHYLFNCAVKDYADSYYSRALSEVDELIRLDSLETNYLLLKARLLGSYLKDYNTSILLLDKALKISPKNSLLLKSKVRFLIKKKEYACATQVLEEGFGTDLDMESSVLLSSILFLSGKTEAVKASRNFLFSLVETSPLPELYEQIAQTYINSNVDSAVYFYNKCISLDSINQKYYVDLASCYCVNDRLDKAKEVINIGIEKSKDDDQLYYLLSQIAYGEINYESSLLSINKAIKSNCLENYIYQRGVIYDSIGNYQLAYEDYKSLLINKPWESKYLKAVSSYELEGGYYSEAISTIHNSMEYDMSLEDSTSLILMNAYFFQSEFDSAYKYVDYGVVKMDTSYDNLYLRLVLYASHEEYDNSLKLCEELQKNYTLTKNQDFKVTYLKSMIFLLQRKYDDFYALADSFLNENNRSSFVENMKFGIIDPLTNSKRELVLKPLGNSEYSIYVNLEKKELNKIKKRYHIQ